MCYCHGRVTWISKLMLRQRYYELNLTAIRNGPLISLVRPLVDHTIVVYALWGDGFPQFLKSHPLASPRAAGTVRLLLAGKSGPSRDPSTPIGTRFALPL